MEKTIYYEMKKDGIAFLVINKPQRKNAIDGQMMDDLTVNLMALDNDANVQVIVLKGQGEHFSAGGDLKQNEGRNLTVGQSRQLLKKYTRTVLTIQQLNKPVIAMVDGYAIGGAMSLALACDLIVVSDRAKFIANFVQIGIVPEMGAMLFLPQLIGPYRAKELWYSGRTVGADEACRLGFANRIATPDNLEKETMELAESIAGLSAPAVQITKNITNGVLRPMLHLILEAESTASPFCTQTREYQIMAKNFNK
ncbi:enoyl-CoA hydratase/isomerase family protein [Sporolactobacillus sp. CQH2019]|uniref:enoyl-CoA hydratase/isomerase family protein n=1 Tax=Sporolactobacillus sp. CQH2019 TaxID=3023512 RepID=UPI002367FE7C|nr:enoyl-CoA hydratase/isomerase family protein [Sporolactobacillus sp. CQH2019]MDD9146953.1 enoyl-CoA hydratase/isomerase family protein [Sporolactobacillus sp. CQH2019]